MDTLVDLTHHAETETDASTATAVDAVVRADGEVTGSGGDGGGGISTLTRPDVTIQPSDPDLEEDDAHVAHIVKVKKGEDAQAKVLEARITGTPIEALCGHIWVPARDPRQLPVCQKCKEMYELYRRFNGKLPETPSD